jgi:cutinase
LSVNGSDGTPSRVELPAAHQRSKIFRVIVTAAVAATLLCHPVLDTPRATAEACPNVEVIFARGTFEPPGIGATGQALVDSLRRQLGGESVEVYAVNYPASLDFAKAADGIIDANHKVRDVAAACPDTKMVLGGYSQGAAVIGYLTTDTVPAGFALPAGLTGPMPASVSNHVAAVTLFGKPSNGFLNMVDTTAPPITIGRLYAPKTLDLCIPEDPVCSLSGGDNGAHRAYAVNGMTDQAAGFAAQHALPA